MYWTFTHTEEMERCRNIVVEPTGEMVCRDTGEVLGYAYEEGVVVDYGSDGEVVDYKMPLTMKNTMYKPSVLLAGKLAEAIDMLRGIGVEYDDEFSDVLLRFFDYLGRKTTYGSVVKLVSPKKIAVLYLYWQYLCGRISLTEFNRARRRLGWRMDRRALLHFKLFYDGVDLDIKIYEKAPSMLTVPVLKAKDISFSFLFPRG